MKAASIFAATLLISSCAIVPRKTVSYIGPSQNTDASKGMWVVVSQGGEHDTLLYCSSNADEKTKIAAPRCTKGEGLYPPEDPEPKLPPPAKKPQTPGVSW